MGYTLACYLAKLNYLVDTVENKKHYVYLGKKYMNHNINSFDIIKENCVILLVSLLFQETI